MIAERMPGYSNRFYSCSSSFNRLIARTNDTILYFVSFFISFYLSQAPQPIEQKNTNTHSNTYTTTQKKVKLHIKEMTTHKKK